MSDTEIKRSGLWGRALGMAEQAPATRNRYVDFLRALSILAVVVGHWLVAPPISRTARSLAVTCSAYCRGPSG